MNNNILSYIRAKRSGMIFRWSATSRLFLQTARHLVRQCCLCEADWEEHHWSLFHCGSCFPLRVFASMMIEQNHPDRRKRSSSLRPARVTAMPPDVSKAQAWMLWKFFHHLTLGPTKHWKTNMEPENVHWEKETSLQTIHFRIPCWFLGVFPQWLTPLTLEALTR